MNKRNPRIMVCIPIEFKERLDELSNQTKQSISSLVRAMIANELSRITKKTNN